MTLPIPSTPDPDLAYVIQRLEGIGVSARVSARPHETELCVAFLRHLLAVEKYGENDQLDWEDGSELDGGAVGSRSGGL